jgi:hypothetical protein
MESMDAGWTQGGNSIWLQFDLYTRENKEFQGQLKRVRSFQERQDTVVVRQFSKQKGAGIPWWDPSGLSENGDENPVDPESCYAGSSESDDVYVDVYAQPVSQQATRVYLYHRDRKSRPEPKEAIWRVLQSDLPDSARSIEYWQSSFAGNSLFLSRFDLPPDELELFLGKARRLPGVGELSRNPQLEGQIRNWSKDVRIAWWKVGELQDPVCARVSSVKKASDDPASRAVFVETTDICAAPVADGFLRVYVRFQSGD